ncbi:MAG: diguanylate cyclase [Vicinamibacteria bacterium]
MRRLLSVAGLALAAASARAEDAPVKLDVGDAGAPTFTVYASQDGLSDEAWSTIGFDGRGFAWAGSASSLARFDGYRWTPWPISGARSLVRDMEQDGHGNLWAVFEREGLARYDGRSWAVLGPAMFHQRFSDTQETSGTRQLWIAYEKGFRRLVEGAWVEDPGNEGAPPNYPIAIEQTETLFGERRQWMAMARQGLWYRPLVPGAPPGRWRPFEAPGFAALAGTDLLRTFDRGREELWVLTYGDGLHRIRADGIRVWSARTGELPTDATYSAVATRGRGGERVAWISSRAGLLRIRGDEVTVFDRRHGLPSDAVRGLKLQRLSDGTDLLWLATEGGIARAALADSQWQTVSLLGARENGTFGVLLEPDGEGGERLWVGSAKQGLGLLQRGEWRYFSLAKGTLPSEGVRAIWRVTGPDGRPWRLVSLIGGRLLRIHDDLSMTRVAVPWPEAPGEAANFALSRRLDGADELWIARERTGIYRLRGGTWTHFPPPGGGVWTVVGLAEQTDATGRSWLWAASFQGLARFDGTRWETLPDDTADGYRSVTLVDDGGRSVLWAGSNRNGIVHLDVTDPGRPRPVTLAGVPPPPDPTVYSVLRDSQGRIYVCTNNGVQQLTPVKDGYHERVFRRRDGLVHDECNTNAQHVDAHDRYWVGTLGGLSVYDPHSEAPPRDAPPKPLFFTDFRVDGTHYDPLVEPALALPAGARELRIDFSLLSGQRELESVYSSRLVGYDPEPSDWTPEHSRSFTGLPPGTYELEVRARDYAGTIGPPSTLRFTARPFWWQVPTVRYSSVVLLVLVAAGSARLYNRTLRARHRQLEHEVAARTTELNSANERLTELSYADALTGVANRRRLIEAIEAAVERAVAKSLPIGLVVVDVDHFKDYNDRFGHLAGDAALRAVAQALEQATREQDLVARFGGEEFACLLLDAPLATVSTIAERMRALVEALPPRALGNESQTITISAGYLSRVPAAGEGADDLLERGDAALYQAKRDGRNRIRAAAETAARMEPGS